MSTKITAPSYQKPSFFIKRIAFDLLLGVGIALLLGIGLQQTIELEQSRVEEKNKNLIGNKALVVAAQIESEVHADVYLANGLVALVVAAPNLSHTSIETALKVLHGTSAHLKNIALAPGNRISYVYPLAGNEKILGLYYPDIPEQWVKVQQAIDRKTTVLAGPLPLRQGGTGLVSRTPVFMPDGSYWGLLSLVINSDILLEHAQQTAAKQGLVIAVRGKDGLGEKGAVFWGDAELFADSSALLDIHIPGGTWQLAARPMDSIKPASSRYQKLELAAWAISGLMGILIFMHLRGRHRIHASEKQLRAILDTSPDGVVVLDNTGQIQVFNPSAEAMFGYSAAEVLGQHVSMLMDGQDAPHHYFVQPPSISPHYMAKGREVRGRRQNGALFPIEIKVSGVDVEGRRLHVGILRDITEQQLAQQKLIQLATRDGLTKVFNRRVLMEFLEEQLLLAIEHQQPLSILMIDADHFKSINDRFGHHVGDQVLIRLAELSHGCVGADGKFGRIGGEEFLAVLPNTDSEQAQVLARKLLHTIAETRVDVGGTEPLQFTVSMGVASSSKAICTPEDLLKRADMALYRAKEQGRNRYVVADGFKDEGQPK